MRIFKAPDQLGGIEHNIMLPIDNGEMSIIINI